MRLIDADALCDDVMERYCKDCEKRKGIKRGKWRVIYEIGEAPCRACDVDDLKMELDEAPTIEAKSTGQGKKLIYEATIELEPKTKKNGSRIVLIKGVPRIIPSKEFEAYQTGAGFFLGFPEGLEAINERVNLECKFYRRTKRRVDLVNLEQAICDILVHYGVLADDSFNIIARMDGSEVLIDKERPRTEVRIYRLEENEDDTLRA